MKKKIIRFTADNARLSQGSSIQSPRVSMLSKGAFRFNRSALDLIGLKVGDGVEFLQDGEDWYVAKNEKGLPLNRSKNGGAFAHSVILRHAIVGSMSEDVRVEKGSFRIVTGPVVVDGSECYAVIVRDIAARKMI